MDKNKKNKIINFQHILRLIFLKKFWQRIKKNYNAIISREEKIKKKTGIELLVGLCKIYQFKKIQAYNEKMKWSMAIKRLVIPFIRHEFNEFMHQLRNLKLFNIFASKIKHYYRNKL